VNPPSSQSNSRRHEKVYLLLAFISLQVLLYSVHSITSVVTSPTDIMGPVSLLPLSFWLGFGMIIACVIAAYLDRGVTSQWVFLIIAIILTLWLFLIGTALDIFIPFYPAGEARNLLVTGHTDLQKYMTNDTYYAWPGLHFLSLPLIHVAGLQLLSILRIIPVILAMMVPFILFALGKRIGFSLRQTFGLTCVVLSALWLPFFGYAPQTLAFILSLVLLLLLFSPKITSADIFIMLPLFFTITMTHALTSFALLLATSIILAYRRRFLLIAVIFVVFVIYQMFVVPYLLETGVGHLKRSLLEADFLQVFGQHRSAEGISSITPKLKLMYTIYVVYFITLLIGTVCALFHYIRGKVKGSDRRMFTVAILFLIGLLPLMTIEYGLQMQIRIYLLGLVPLCIMIIIAFPKPVIVASLILLFLTLHIPAHYVGETAGLRVLDTEMAGSKFFAVRIDPEVPYYYRNFHLMWYYNSARLELADRGFGDYTASQFISDKTRWVVQSKADRYYNELQFGRDNVQEWIDANRDNLDRVYTSGTFEIYWLTE